ncbi:MAG: hypothetical protein CMD08_02085 [Flavobacteriales bacterium]|nr:hypothetical protein [Flavobacteriales bacterium]|tara:strand:+ start:186 stop:473 length:288 start_codon:yes stop_codon:yes gene_type:complete
MEINHETRIDISIVTDFITCSLENEIIIKKSVKVKDVLKFIDALEETKNIKTSIYKNSFLASFCESIVCVNILNSSISWDDIISYKNIYSYYEFM